MIDSVYLSNHQKAKLQNQKQIFCILRMMNYIEKFYNTDKIDKNTHQTEMTKLLEKYSKFSQIIPNFSLAEFQKKYHIAHEDISWAKYVIDKGINGQQSKQTFTYVQATATFIETMDALNFCADNPVVGELKPSLQKLSIILKKLISKLGPDFSNKYNNFVRLIQGLQAKSFSQVLTDQEYKQIKFNVEGLYGMFNNIVQN